MHPLRISLTREPESLLTLELTRPTDYWHALHHKLTTSQLLTRIQGAPVKWARGIAFFKCFIYLYMYMYMLNFYFFILILTSILRYPILSLSYNLHPKKKKKGGGEGHHMIATTCTCTSFKDTQFASSDTCLRGNSDINHLQCTSSQKLICTTINLRLTCTVRVNECVYCSTPCTCRFLDEWGQVLIDCF